VDFLADSGAFSLAMSPSLAEKLGIKIDPGTGKLEYSRPYGLAILAAIKR